MVSSHPVSVRTPSLTLIRRALKGIDLNRKEGSLSRSSDASHPKFNFKPVIQSFFPLPPTPFLTHGVIVKLNNKKDVQNQITYTNTVRPYPKPPTPYAGPEPYTRTALTSQQSLHPDPFFFISLFPPRDYQKQD